METKELKTKLDKSIEFLKNELAQIRTGRASPALVEDIPVEAYDTIMTIKEVGSISSLDSQNLVIAPWDKSLLKPILSAIRDSDKSFNPVQDGEVIRVPVPALNEDRRKELARLVSTKLEECKNSLRSIRQDAMKDIDKLFNEKQLSEDEKFTQKDKVEDILKEYNEKATDIAEAKKEDVLKI